MKRHRAPNPNQRPSPVNGAAVKVDKRRREWRTAHPDEAKPIGFMPRRATRAFPCRRNSHRPIAVQINFCPRCGCDLHTLAVGMAVATSS